MEILYRFLIGGAVVSLFAMIGDIVRPKSYAGIFGGAPSVALATLALTISADGPSYAALEARSMVVGAAALAIYAGLVCRILWRCALSVTVVATGALTLWLAIALLGWWLLLR